MKKELKTATYTHKKGGRYSIINICKYKHDGTWYNGISYKCLTSGEISVTQESEFEKEYKIV